MTNFNYFKISKSKKIRYLKYFRKKATYIVFLHGFMSDLEGNKPKAFYEFAKKNNLGFLALEYSGHGKSYGKFIDGNISSWSKDVKILIKKIVRNNKMILVGSSMGSWISLNQFKYFKKKNLWIFRNRLSSRIFRTSHVEKIFNKKEKRNSKKGYN